MFRQTRSHSHCGSFRQDTRCTAASRQPRTHCALTAHSLRTHCTLTAHSLPSRCLQRAIDKVISDNSSQFSLPGAIYIDAVGPEGTIKTGTSLASLTGSATGSAAGTAPNPATAAFAYADTLLLFNVQQVGVGEGEVVESSGVKEWGELV